MLERFKIIPLLIVVSMLSFSVRLVEVGIGVKNLSGSALAASEKEEETHDQGKSKDMASAKADDDKPIKFDEEKEGQAEDKKPVKKKKKTAKKDEDSGIEWRDASDLDEEVSTVRMEMLQDLVDRRKGLEKRERALVTREALLRAAEQELDRKYQEMSALRNEIKALLETQSKEEKARIQSLVKIYEGMKAKEAARIFDTLDLDVLVNVMSRMSERKIAPIMAAMNPDRARQVTILLAEQKSLPDLPKN